MINSNKVWLSHTINDKTPLYGGRTENYNLYKTSSMDEGKIANDTRIETTVHLGTHIDLPYHFHNDGQTIDDFDIDFWFFEKPLYIELKPNGFIIKDELIRVLNDIKDKSFDILIIKTGICNFRSEDRFWKENFGFDPDIYEYLIKNLHLG